MRKTLLALSLLFVCLGNAALADHSYPRTFDGHIVFCAPQSPPVNVEVLPDGTQILNFVNIGNVWLTGNPLIDGLEENFVTATIPPNSPPSRIEISATVDVDAVDGRWRVRQLIIPGPDGDVGYGIGIGTGDLRGRLIVFRSGTPEMIENSPCVVPFGVPISGRIVTFGWRT